MSITTSTIDTARTRRAAAAAAAEHSGELEGLSITPEMRHDTAAYVEGQIDSDELVERTRARYGVA